MGVCPNASQAEQTRSPCSISIVMSGLTLTALSVIDFFPSGDPPTLHLAYVEAVRAPQSERQPPAVLSPDDLDDSVSPNLGKVTEVELPDYDPDFVLDGDDDGNN